MKRQVGALGILGCVLIACSGAGGVDGSNGANGTNGAAGDSGRNSLVDVANEPSGAKCPDGGSRIRTGLDANGNGVLDDDEVTSTTYVCSVEGATGKDGADGKNGNDGKDGIDGKSGLSVVMTMTDEPSGANCPNGGKKVQTGLDDNGDGTLDESEIDQTSYVCNGANGSNGSAGSNGLNSLVNVTDEPPGLNCDYGGKKLETGIDDNKDGVLGASEVDQTAYVCNGGYCGGKRYKNACWYAGAVGDNCTNTCSTHGGYDEATRTVTGDLGTNADCGAVLGLLGFSGTTSTGTGILTSGFGCANALLGNTRYISAPTSADGANLLGLAKRACACKN